LPSLYSALALPGTLVLLDYLQVMPICNSDIGSGNPRYLEIRHIMDMGIIAAEKTQSVIIATAQCGDIEQTAWNLIKMARKKENDKDALSFRIVKARSSEGGGNFSLEWIPGYQYMEYGGKLALETKPPNKDKGKEAPEDGDKGKRNYGL
jgi:hypothetical protein